MRLRRGVVIAGSWLLCGTWIGCNVILGNESAVFDPAQGDAAGESGDPDGALPDGALPDGTIPDGANPEAGPCVNRETNPRHCGACFHDCLAGDCVGGQCQPFVVAKDPGGKLVALAVSSSHVYWTNDSTGDLMRAPILGGTPELFFDGSPDAGLGTDIAYHQGYVYFADNPGATDGGIARCPETGCAAGPDTVVAHVDQPTTVAIDNGSILFAEGLVGGRVGRCASPPCLDGFDVIASNEKFPLRVAGKGDVVVWSTLLAPIPGNPPDVRVKIGAAAPTKAASAFGVYPVAIVGGEVLYAVLSGPLRAAPLDGGAPRVVSFANAQTDYLAVEGTTVYYADTVTEGKVLRLDMAAGPVDGGTVIASKQKRPRAIATDTTSIYWINEDTETVMRIAK